MERLLYSTRRVALPVGRRAFLRALGAGALAPFDSLAAGMRADQLAQGKPRRTDDLWRDADAVARRIVPPRFPSRVFDITKYGARAGGADCTRPLREAIGACHDAGGGQVLVPAGRFTTGPIVLR